MTSVNTDDFSPEVRNAAWWSGDSRLAANGRAADAILVKQGKKQPPDLSEVEEVQMGKVMEPTIARLFQDKHRIELKDADYVQHHKMLGKYSVSDLVKAVLEGEIEEVAAYYPHLLKPMEDLKEAIDQYYSKAVNACRYMNRMDRYTRAEIYEDSTYQYDSFIVKQVMNNLGKTDLEIIDNVADAIKNLGLGFGKTAGQPKRLIELLRYNSLLHTEESDTLNV